jgi:hypothetical protein
MGACCCKLFSKGEQAAPKEEDHKTQLITNRLPLAASRYTENDAQFTYFLKVFELSSCGAILKRPEYADEANPDFSYQKFHEVHRQYYQLVRELGLYIESRKNPHEQLHKRIQEDSKKIEHSRRLLGFERSKLPGCMVKLEVQGVEGSGVEEIAVMHHHPQHWSGKFEETFKVSQLQAGPLYFEFVVPEIFTSSLKIVGRPRHLQL